MRRIYVYETFAQRAGQVPLWRVALAAVVACAVALALALLVSGLFLVLLPAIVVGAVVLRFLGRRVPSPPPRAEAGVIEADYEVIEDKSPGDRPQ